MNNTGFDQVDQLFPAILYLSPLFLNHLSTKPKLTLFNIYTDFSKAFDRVDHAILIKILSDSSFGEPILSWFSSYLFNRKQWVKLNGSTSSIFTPSSGVLQGAILSLPILFSLLVQLPFSLTLNFLSLPMISNYLCVLKI